MRCTSALKIVAGGLLSSVVLANVVYAQVGGQNGAPWRGAGPQPCFSPIDNAANKCAPAAETIAT